MEPTRIHFRLINLDIIYGRVLWDVVSDEISDTTELVWECVWIKKKS